MLVIAALPERIVLKPPISLIEQFGGHRQVVLSTPDIEMAKVGSQLGKQALYISAGAIPSNDTINRCGMAQVMNMRSRTPCCLVVEAGEVQ